MRHVRATTQIDEITLSVKRYDFIIVKFFDDLRLVFFAHAAKQFNRIFLINHLAAHRQVFRCNLFHAFFDFRQIVFRKSGLKCEIIVKTVFNDRSDRHLRLRKQSLDCMGQQVRTRMSNDFKPLFVAPCDDPERTALVDLIGGVVNCAIEFTGDRCFAQPCADF